MFWSQQGVYNTSNQVFLNKLKTRLTDQYIQNWSKECQRQVKAVSNEHIKSTFQFEEYLENIENGYFRKSLTKVRIGSHNFSMERGRWKSPKMPITE